MILNKKFDFFVLILFTIIIYYFLGISNDGFAYISLSKNILNFDFYTIDQSLEVKYPLSYPFYITPFIEFFDLRIGLVVSSLLLYYIFYKQILFFNKSSLISLIISLFFFKTFSNVGSESLFIVLILYVFILLKKQSKKYLLISFVFLILLETKYISLSILPFIILYYLRKKNYKPIYYLTFVVFFWALIKFLFLGTITGDGRFENTDSILNISLHFFHLFDIDNIYYSFSLLILFIILLIKYEFKFDSFFLPFIILYSVLLFYSRVTTSFDMISPRFLSICLILIILSFNFKSKYPYVILFSSFITFFLISDFKTGDNFFNVQKSLTENRYENVISGNKYLNNFSTNFFVSEKYNNNDSGKIIHLYSQKINKQKIIIFRNSNIKIIIN